MNNIKLFILFIVSLLFLSFFDPIFISVTLLGQLITAVSLFILSMYLFQPILFPARSIRSQITDSLAFPVNLMLIAMLLSMIPAYLYRNQSIFSSIIGYKNFYVFFLYFILFKYEVSQKQVLGLSIFFFFITLLIFIIDYYTFPNTYFSWRSEVRRDAFTILFKGQGFTLLGTFFFLALFLRTAKFYYCIFYALGFCFLNFFNASRMMTFSLIVGTFFILIYYRKTVKKYFLYTVPILVVGLAAGIYYLQSYILGLFLLTLDQRNSGYSIRYEAIKFFTNKFQPNVITKIVGNGYPNSSGTYQDSFTAAQYYYGFFTSDIGLIGFWTYFGILGVISWLLIFKKIFFWKTDDNNVFIKPYFIYLLITVTSGYAIFDPGYMLSTVFCLFLFDKNKQA